MAYDKIIDSAKISAAMTATADKIRAGTGNTGKLTWDESKGFSDSIPSPVTQATPSIFVSSGGLITASATQTGGFVASGTKSATQQLSTQGAKTVTPGTSNQTAVSSGVYTTGAITVKGDSNLKAANIAKGVSIFGVAGSFEGSSKSATGTFTGPASGSVAVTISGLGFKPSKVVIFESLSGVSVEKINRDWRGVIAYIVSTGTATHTAVPSYEEAYDEESDDYTYYSSVNVTNNRVSVTMNNDGFAISYVNSATTPIFRMSSEYTYIALS